MNSIKKWTALALTLLLAALPCALAEDGEQDWATQRRLRLGSALYSVLIDNDYEAGELSDEDVVEGQVGYYRRDEGGLDFDVYQFAKDDPSQQLNRYVLEEAMEYDNVIEVRPRERVGDIDIAWYRTYETFEGVEYETLNVLADGGNSFVELVFWLESEADAEQAWAIVNSLEVTGLQTIQLGNSSLVVVAPDDFVPGGLTLEDEEDDEMAYWYSEGTGLDFDVYQFSKDGLPESVGEYTAQEAGEYPAVRGLVTDSEINGVPAGWYRAVEMDDGVDYNTVTYILDAGDSYVEVVFWLDGVTSEDEADYIIGNLTDTSANR